MKFLVERFSMNDLGNLRKNVNEKIFEALWNGILPMNRTPPARRTQIINCPVEGNSIRSTERMTGTHRDPICRLLVEVGTGCQPRADERPDARPFLPPYSG